VNDSVSRDGMLRAAVAHGSSASLLPRLWLQVAAVASVVAVGIFVLGMMVAISGYPGGSWTAPTAPGFSLVRNFWCDLLRSQAINGADNAGSKLIASLAFGALGVGLWPYWWVAGAVLQDPWRRRVARLGTASAASLFSMSFLPSDRFPVIHGVVALTGAALGIWATGASVASRSAFEPRFAVRRVSGAVLIVSAVVNALLYVYVAYLGGAETVAQPIAQKIATAALVLWMLSTVQLMRRMR
jgi:hypothetical protein